MFLWQKQSIIPKNYNLYKRGTNTLICSTTFIVLGNDLNGAHRPWEEWDFYGYPITPLSMMVAIIHIQPFKFKLIEIQ
jgi:hypothetical protein